VSTSEFDDAGPTDPFRTLDPEQRLALHGEATGDDLVAAVLADPDNDELRLVYGDYLIEHEDPRGELIQLQRQTEKATHYDRTVWDRQAELLQAHWTEWCAPLHPALEPTSIEFRRGFLWRCKTLDNTMVLRDVIGHPMWRTVGDLQTFERALLTNPCVRGVKRFRTGTDGVVALGNVTHELAVEHLDLLSFHAQYAPSYYDHFPQVLEHALWPRLADLGPLRHVRAITARTHVDPRNLESRTFLQSPLGNQLEVLEYYAAECTLEPWEFLMREHSSLRRLHVHTGRAIDRRSSTDRGGAILERDADGNIHPILAIDTDPHAHEAIVALATMPADYRSVEILVFGALFDEVTQPLVERLRQRFDDVIVRAFVRP